MPFPCLHACVRLIEDIPTLWLRSGDHGTVVSVWLSPCDLFFEVQFEKSAASPPIRALLRSEQLEVVEPHVLKVESDVEDLTEPSVLANCGFSARLLATHPGSNKHGQSASRVAAN